MIFFPWLFVAFGLGWCLGRLLLNKWWRAELQKLEISIKENAKQRHANSVEMIRLVDECKAIVAQSGGKKDFK